MTGKTPIWIALTLFSLLSLFHFEVEAQEETSGELTQVVVALKWQHQFQFAGYYAAIEQGYYRDFGIEVELVEASEGVSSLDRVRDGEAAFGIGASDVIVARSSGSPLVALAAIFQHSPLVLIAREDTGIDNLHQIAGQRVMLEPGSDELIAYLADEGVSLSQLVRYPHVYDIEPFVSSQVDAMSAYTTDEIFLLDEADVGYRVFTPRSSGIDFYSDVLFTTSDFIDQNPQIVADFLSATIRGWYYAFENIPEMIHIIQEQYATTHSEEHLRFEARAMRELVLPEVVEIGYMNPRRWAAIADTYTRLGLMEESVDLNKFLYTGEQERSTNIMYSLLAGAGIMLILLLIIVASSIINLVAKHLRG